MRDTDDHRQREPARSTRSALLLGGLIVLALVLRFWRLGDWNFEATEMFTRRDSITQPRWTNARPLIYLLNYYVVRPIMPLDEFRAQVSARALRGPGHPRVFLLHRTRFEPT